ncbi:MAG: PSD1 and planctomycete cytochrome C domain-containing protein [Verrucomicrobiia bacterium]|jgi:hypothetical protein
MKHRKLQWTMVAALVGVGAALSPTNAEAASARETAFFEQYVRPVLARECYRCHSEKEDSRKGGLTLDTRDGIRKGGDSGPAVVPRNPSKSLLVKAIQYHDKDLQMPPKNKKLKSADINALTQWVLLGAPYPDGSAPANTAWTYNDQTLGHWAFQPVRKPPVPNTLHKDWVKTPIDSFIAQKLEEKNIEPQKMAGKRTVLRRLSFDLTGLPPTLEEIAAFEKDTSERAYEKAVDRLLGSKHFGERWGRHWLDVARYADTKGDANRSEVRLYPYAWAYRDYVVTALNDDKPYDQFILEQLAADQFVKVGKAKPDSWAAMGFLTLGNRFDGNREEIFNDRIDTITKGLQALTVSCARCHDHKFDPIPQSDYYALRGILMSSQELGEDELPLLAHTANTKSAAYKSFVTEYQKRHGNLEKFYREDVNKWLGKMRKHSQPFLVALAKYPRDRRKGNEYLAKYNTDREKGGQKLSKDDKLNRDDIRYGYDHWRNVVAQGGNGRRVGLHAIFKPWVDFVNLSRSGVGNFRSKAPGMARKIAARKDAYKRVNPRLAHAFRGVAPRNIEDVARIYGSLFRKAEDQMETQNKIRTTSSRLMDSQLEAFRGVTYMAGSDLDPVRARKQSPFDKVRRFVSRGMQGQEVRLKTSIAELEMTHPGAPARAMVMKDKGKPENSRLFIRGETRSPGEMVPRQYIKIVDSKRRPYPATDSGRVRMALEIADKDNPLTARVMVNRIWQHLFGEGFVPTPDDLGVQSDPPSHRELIDYLSAEFMEKGWSIKKTIKQIVMSSVYRQTSDGNARYAQVDPQNRLLWRQNIRRLEFEPLRDSILAIGGTLDKTIGGKPFNLKDENSRRRTIYARIDRGSLPEVFNHFDFANPDMTSGKRYDTTVPQQALFMMNSPLVIELAKKLVNRKDFMALKEPEARIKLLYELIFQRSADEQDIEMGISFIGDSPADLYKSDTVKVAFKPGQKGKGRKAGNSRDQKRAPLGAWEKFAHALLQTNEASFIN